MGKKDTLLRRIDTFLAERSKASSGYAPVGEGDIDALHDIVNRLLELKYEGDMDGDLPVTVILADRTQFERPHVVMVPYSHQAPEAQQVERLLEAARLHSSAAQVHAESANRALQSANSLTQHLAKLQANMEFAGQTYRVVLPAEVTAETVKAAVQLALDKAWKKEICPVDSVQRSAWALRVAEAVRAATGARIQVFNCMHTVEGVRLYYGVPALGARDSVRNSPPVRKAAA